MSGHAIFFPSDPFDKKKPDEEYLEEFVALQDADIACCLYSAEDFETGEFRVRPPFAGEENVVYRGWMLTPGQYLALSDAVIGSGATLLTSTRQYLLCHYLPEWYPFCKDVTPGTRFFDADTDFVEALQDSPWRAFFVKDYVKSLTTSRGSIARTTQEISEIVALIRQFRGRIEGGVCVREFEDFQPDTEERYFVFRGRAFAREGEPPDFVKAIAGRIESPFFSVDTVLNAEGQLRLIELGDGQVSDRKKWSPLQFVEMIRQP